MIAKQFAPGELESVQNEALTHDGKVSLLVDPGGARESPAVLREPKTVFETGKVPFPIP
jgi:hypothetical protein